MRSEVLYGDDFVCVASGANGSIGDRIEAGDYLGLPHVILKLGDGVDSLVERAWSKLGITPRIAATTTSFASMLFMVSESQLIATVQRRLARRFERMLPIRVLDCPVDIAPLSGIMSWHVAFEDDPAHAYLRRVFAQTAAVSHNPAL